MAPSSTTTRPRSLLLLLSLAAAAIVSVAAAAVDTSAHTLPIIFIHGASGSATDGANLEKNLSTDARPFASLNFCEGSCASGGLVSQVTKIIDQIRSTTKNDSRFDNGYVLIGWAQGAVLSRTVIEEMDDHKVHTFISLAGAQNGVFYGPQDATLASAFRTIVGPRSFSSVFNFSSYTEDDTKSGKLMVDFLTLLNNQISLQDTVGVANLMRSPVHADWEKTNKYLAVYNGLQTPNATTKDRARRKSNFLRLKAAHFFASPDDATLAPWQTSMFGQYEEVDSLTTLGKKFTTLSVIPMNQTVEYKQDTFGLRSLDERRGLHLYEVAGIGHDCWIKDSTPNGGTQVCKFQSAFEKYVYPLVGPITKK